VLYDKISKSINCNKVVVDDIKAAYNATKHLINTGCKRIAHIRGPLTPQTTIDRFKGYKQALLEHNIEFDKTIVFEAAHLSFEDGMNIAEDIVKNHKDIDAIFAFTDLVASGALIRLKELDVKIPDDISIMGYSNWFLTRITTPTLSTVDQPGFYMGKAAFELLLDEINSKKNHTKVTYKTKEISTKVIIRDSTK